MKIRKVTMGIAASLGIQQSVWASGYQFDLQSVRAQANANANAAEASDPSTIFYNPAGLAMLDGTQMTLGTTAVDPHSTFSYSTAIAASGQPILGNTGGDYGGEAVIPHGYVSHRLSDDMVAGVGLFVPYGAPIDYDEQFVGRYFSNAIDFKSVALNPSLGIELSDQHHIGLGLSAQYLDIELQNNIETSAVAFASCMAGVGVADLCLPVAGVYAGQPDSKATISGTDWGYGFNLGYLFTPGKATRIGLAYRSYIHHQLSGDAIFSVPATLPGGDSVPLNGGIRMAMADSNAKVDLTTPETLSAHLYHQLLPDVAVMADIAWNRHSRLQNIAIQIPTDMIPTRNIAYKTAWRNSLRASVGLSYKATEQWTWRTGYMYDQSPVTDAKYTLTVLPDANRQMYSLGGSYSLSEKTTIDFAYSFLRLNDAAIQRTDDDYIAENGSPGTLTGEYDAYFHLLGLSLSYHF